MSLKKYEAAAKRITEKQKKIQVEIAAVDKLKSKSAKSEKPMQAGGRKYPAPEEFKTHLQKPGKEKDLDLQPYCDAPYYKGSEKLANKVALITGGDSGIGRSVAIFFAREGADIAIVYLSEHEDAEATKRMVEAEGKKCILFSGDVSDKKFCVFTVEQTVKEFGQLDILVNNSAFQHHAPSIVDISEEHVDLTFKTNLYGYFFMAQAAVAVMKYGSAIINTGSVTGIMGSESLIDYSTTKGGIHAFTRALGTQLVAKGIRVNAVAPGPVWTPLNPADKQKKDIGEFGADTPMKRAAQPEEIAPAFVFLASNQCSSYITGEVLPVIGGYGGG